MMLRSTHMPPELEALAQELHGLGKTEPQPAPSATRRAELRLAVLTASTARKRPGVGGVRGAALAIAAAAGGGLVIASAAGGGNPAGRMVEVVKDIGAPVIVGSIKESPRLEERPAEEPAPAVAAPGDEAVRPPSREAPPSAVETREDPAREPERPTATPTPLARPKDAVGNEVPPAPVATRPVESNASEARPEPTKAAPVTNAGEAPTRTATPVAEPTAPAEIKPETEDSNVPGTVPPARTPDPTPTPAPKTAPKLNSTDSAGASAIGSNAPATRN